MLKILSSPNCVWMHWFLSRGYKTNSEGTAVARNTLLQIKIFNCEQFLQFAVFFLTLYSIDTLFNASTTHSFENNLGKEEIARNEQFLLFPKCFLLNQKIVSLFVYNYDIISLFAAELEEAKINMWIKGKIYLVLLGYQEMISNGGFFFFFLWGRSNDLFHTVNIIYSTLTGWSAMSGYTTLWCSLNEIVSYFCQGNTYLLIHIHLTHYQRIPHFDALKIYSCGIHCEKRRNYL